MKLDAKNETSKKQEQNVQTAQKHEPIIRVRSELRAGVSAIDDAC